MAVSKRNPRGHATRCRERTPDLLSRSSRSVRVELPSTREVDRLRQILDWTCHNGCQSAALARRFGQSLDRDCGHCSWCRSEGRSIEITERPHQEIDETRWRDAGIVRSAHPEVLLDTRAFARWLCGVSSPRLVQARLTRDPLFGVLAGVPFARVLERARGADEDGNDSGT